ncbi:AraC family transcriptional regulator [Nocardioides zeae]|uniref:helix-turn-helix domain-containing protein n=1 Tax=Nocardioides zeae TaxID=1457234 RepID=UPI0027D78714|nr:helix-turn-helix domain-containing protein [Nocardioides zeae]
MPYAAGAGGDLLEVVTLEQLRRRMARRGVGRRTERPEFHLLLHLDGGEMVHTVDFREYAVGAGSWLWVRPGQVQRFGDLSGVDGALVLFREEALDPSAASAAGVGDPFGRTLWTPDSESAAATVRSLDHLRLEFESLPRHSHVRLPVLHHLLAALLLRLTDPSGQLGTAAAPEHSEPFLAFRRLVEVGFVQHRDVEHYARELGYSSRTLRRATITATGVGAKEFIDQRVVLEAKRLLTHEDQPVERIAARLGFPDTSNFVKYFAHRTATTPATFRARARGRDQPPGGRRRSRSTA